MRLPSSACLRPLRLSPPLAQAPKSICAHLARTSTSTLQQVPVEYPLLTNMVLHTKLIQSTSRRLAQGFLVQRSASLLCFHAASLLTRHEAASLVVHFGV